jgi:hypothetical protein
MSDEESCLFCWNEIESCSCSYTELATKKAFLNFFIDSLKEFSPKIANKIQLYDAVEFVNEWIERNFSEDEEH